MSFHPSVFVKKALHHLAISSEFTVLWRYTCLDKQLLWKYLLLSKGLELLLDLTVELATHVESLKTQDWYPIVYLACVCKPAFKRTMQQPVLPVLDFPSGELLQLNLIYSCILKMCTSCIPLTQGTPDQESDVNILVYMFNNFCKQQIGQNGLIKQIFINV